MVVFGLARTGRTSLAPFAVGARITGAYFLNVVYQLRQPAVALVRTLSDTFAGTAPTSVVPFVLAQIVGARLACVTLRLVWPGVEDSAQTIVVPHDTDVNALEARHA